MTTQPPRDDSAGPSPKAEQLAPRRSWWHSLPSWAFNLVAVAFAFGTYFCMYAFRKPFAAASFEGASWLGLDLKTVFVISQIIGYTISKYVGVKLISEVSRSRRWPMLLTLIALAEVALLGFALLPESLKPLAILCNGLPLGMVWGLVVRYLEGRQTSEFLLAGLSCSFIVASGVVKDIGRWLMGSYQVGEYWMPFCTGLLFLLPFIALATLLDQIPEPTAQDQAQRMQRRPMDAAARLEFFKRFLPGICLLLLVYLVLTAFRDFRDNYGIEMFAELGFADEPAIFTRTELPVALLVLLLMATLGRFKSHRAGLIAVFSVMAVGLALLGLSTLALQLGAIAGDTWMVLIGLGAYLAYVPFGSFLFDRIMAATRFVGTAVFAINLADAIGYTGSVGMQLYKDLVAGEASRLQFFIRVNYALALGGGLLLVLAGAYFVSRTRQTDSEPSSYSRTAPE